MSTTEIHEEAPGTPSDPHAAELSRRAYQARIDGDPVAAVELYDQALQSDPDNPSLRYNRLESKLAAGGEFDEALRECEAILRTHPDYLFAQVLLARGDFERDDLDSARKKLQPLITRSRLHVSEARAIHHLSGLIELQAENAKAAQLHLTSLQSVCDEDEPAVEQLREGLQLLELSQNFGRLASSLGRRFRKG